MKNLTVYFILLGFLLFQSCQNSSKDNSRDISSADAIQANDEEVDDSSAIWIGSPEKGVLDMLQKQCDDDPNCKLSTGPYQNSSRITECDLAFNGVVEMSVLFENGKVRNYFAPFAKKINNEKLQKFKNSLNSDEPVIERVDKGIFSEGKGREGYIVFMYVKDKVKKIGGILVIGVADRSIDSDYIKSLQAQVNKMGEFEVEIIL